MYGAEVPSMYAVEAYDMGKKFENVWAVKSATFTIPRKSVGVIAGPNGAGKTTTIKMLITALKPNKGNGKIIGFDIVEEFREIRKHVAYQPQDYSMFSDLTPEQFIISTLMIRGRGYVEARIEAYRWIEELGLIEIKNRKGWSLSGGERRRAVVAATLATNADVVFLDEPTSGVDVEAKYAVLKVLRSCIRNGSTIVLTTHNLVEAGLVADTIIVIHNGYTLFYGSPTELMEKIPYRYKMTMSKPSGNLSGISHIDLGDKVIIWLKDRSKAFAIAETLGVNTFSIEEVNLEDAYLYLIKSLGEKL